MAVYSRLDLTAGGGIMPRLQQTEQAGNKVTLLIGLGGTGIDCLRTIKTEVHNRLKPDDENSVVPEYSQIRFLGVDIGEPDLDDKRLFNLHENEYFRLFLPEIPFPMLDNRPDSQWLRVDSHSPSFDGGRYSAGIRQLGRFMLMDQADLFMDKLTSEILKAKEGLVNPDIEIHILTGLSGGVGSGCFLDVCYMVRHVLEELGGGVVFGYCFMPDVNLSKIPDCAEDVRKYIPKNGYAAMQELDYCMNLPKNEGSFEQVYKGGRRIQWDAPPVDMCHLICATNANNAVISNAYDYAMNVTAEYIMMLISHEKNANWLAPLLYHAKAVADSNKHIGVNMDYCLIGASSASLPLKEINTYLASELFEKFSQIWSEEPRQEHVEKLAINALANGANGIYDIYLYLMREMRDGAGDDYSAYPDDWRSVIGDNNKAIIRHYKDQTAKKIGTIEYHAKSMMTADNALSLIGRTRAELEEILKDVNRGPIYGYKMLSAAESHNLLNLIDGLIKVNKEKWRHEANQASQRQKDYDDSWYAFNTRQKNSFFESDQKRFDTYEWFLMLYVQHELNLEAYKKMDEVLRSFRKQVENAANGYYSRLSLAMKDLLETFKQNRDALQGETVLSQDAFSEPLMTITDLKDTLDDEVRALNIDGIMNQFMTTFIDNESAWIGGDENRISRLVNDFFVKNVFKDFAGRSITNYLRVKYEKEYGVLPDPALADILYQKWMRKLTAKANPLFAFDAAIKVVDDTTKLAFLSVPETSAPIVAAANKMRNVNNLWIPEMSAFHNRITAICVFVGIPMAAFKPVKEYERAYFSDFPTGRHLPIDGMRFSDWRNLPSLIPRSMIDKETVPPLLQRHLSEVDDLYNSARKLRVLDDEGCLWRLGVDAIEKTREFLKESRKMLDQWDGIPPWHELSEIEGVRQTAVQLEQELPALLEKTEYHLPQEGRRFSAEDNERLNRDFFTAFPVFQLIAAEIVTEMESLLTENRDVMESATNKKEALIKFHENFYPYCDALFAGVILIEGRTIYYEQTKAELSERIILSAIGETFSYGSISPYQGYLTFLDLDETVKDEIKELTKERLQCDAAKLKNSVHGVKSYLTDDRIVAWAKLARVKEKEKEILGFLKNLKEYFHQFCIEHEV